MHTAPLGDPAFWRLACLQRCPTPNGGRRRAGEDLTGSLPVSAARSGPLDSESHNLNLKLKLNPLEFSRGAFFEKGHCERTWLPPNLLEFERKVMATGAPHDSLIDENLNLIRPRRARRALNRHWAFQKNLESHVDMSRSKQKNKKFGPTSPGVARTFFVFTLLLLLRSS